MNKLSTGDRRRTQVEEGQLPFEDALRVPPPSSPFPWLSSSKGSPSPTGGRAEGAALVDPEGVVWTKDRRFESASHLISYHMDSRLPIRSAGSELWLQQPMDRKGGPHISQACPSHACMCVIAQSEPSPPSCNPIHSPSFGWVCDGLGLTLCTVDPEVGFGDTETVAVGHPQYQL
ncbi:hypothetical protein ACRRTK_009552 [Alexandromys fortis]